jgi:large subunit ribosomal protein L4
MEIAVYNTSGKETKKIKLSDEVFGIEPNEHAIYLDAKQHLANKRQGTHKSKERAEISGSTRKIKKQKGTGTARAGSIKSPVFRGGGRVFGPRPRDYHFKLNKKVKTLARKSALSAKVKAEQLIVLEDFSWDAPKTKQYVELLNNLNVAGKKTLIVLGEENNNILLSSRNVQNTEVIPANEISTYAILKAGKVILAESSVEKIVNLLN